MSLKFRGEARKGDKNWGVIRIGDDPEAVRLNEITKSMSIREGPRKACWGALTQRPGERRVKPRRARRLASTQETRRGTE